MLIINEGEICDVRSIMRFDWKMCVHAPIIFPNLRLAISCLEGPMEYFKFPVYKLFFVLILSKSYEIEVF